jgi:monovalent cation/hydrogen antiporter
VQLPPEVMLLVFLPALLYWESLATSLQEIRRNLRGIVLTSTVLVVVTAAAVAAAGHLLGLSWSTAWILGAALAPTDATAVGALARSLPRRTVTVLRAESLVNDGTALVIYGLAVGIAVGKQSLGVLSVSGQFLLAYVGGAVAGVMVAWVAIQVRRRLDDPLQANVAILLTPFAAFLLAEAVNASGVLAVVVSGLVLTQAAPRVSRAATRVQTQLFWSLATFVLNAALFVLIGLEVPAAIRGLNSAGVAEGVVAVVVVVAVLLVVRYVFLVVSVYAIRLIDRRPEQRLRRVSNRSRVVSTFAGFRGAVSLAAALAVPQVTASGLPFPGRDLIVFVAAGVITVTIVVQGLVLPGVVRWAHLPGDASAEERRFAQTRATEAAIDAMPELAADLGTPADVVERLRREFEEHRQVVGADESDEQDQAVRHERQYTELRLAVLARKRATVVRLRDERRIDDSVLLQIQWRLDAEEIRLSQRELTE